MPAAALTWKLGRKAGRSREILHTQLSLLPPELLRVGRWQSACGNYSMQIDKNASEG
jgi:hypothetical protein